MARLAGDLAGRIETMTADISALGKEVRLLVRQLAPSLPALPGAAELTAAKIYQALQADAANSAHLSQAA